MAAPSTILEHTLATAPVKVVKSTAVFAGLGALVGSSIGVIRDVPAIPAAFKTGLNTAAFSFTFFSKSLATTDDSLTGIGIREYCVHPGLSALGLRPSPLVPDPSLSYRTRNLSSTALAGLISGTLFTYVARGSVGKAALRSGATLAIGCTVVQSLVNEGELFRIKAIAWSEERESRLVSLDAAAARAAVGVETKEAPPTYTRSISSATPSVPSRETFSERSDRLLGGAFASLTDTLARISPVKKIDDAEYVAALKLRLGAIDQQRSGLKDELDELSAVVAQAKLDG